MPSTRVQFFATRKRRLWRFKMKSTYAQGCQCPFCLRGERTAQSACGSLAFRPDGALALDGAAPLLIQRAVGTNPVAALPASQLQFRSLHIQHPIPEEVLALFAAIGLDSMPCVTVARGAMCALVAEIQTPSGLRTRLSLALRSSGAPPAASGRPVTFVQRPAVAPCLSICNGCPVGT